jgi:hypothetical protein
MYPNKKKLNDKGQREYRETHKSISAEYIPNYRKCKAQEKVSISIYKLHLFKYKSQFNTVFDVNPGNQGSPITFFVWLCGMS